ncbi:MAG: hypothetical protein PWQ37_3009 [Candidatus Petromonas sp.]|jgi:NADH dehydrogenase/NADH:ubiquinone oxidoreductase subunit G|nr:hypothetical protein [Candidatus Petromonas sp.]
MVKIKFVLEIKEIDVPKGEYLLDAARKSGVVIDAPLRELLLKSLTKQ